MPPASAADEAPATVAVEVARLSGRIDQVIVDHERRLGALEAKQGTSATRAAAVWGPIVAGAALLIMIVDKIQWA